MVIVEIEVVYDTGALTASFFRQPWVAEQIHVDDEVALAAGCSLRMASAR